MTQPADLALLAERVERATGPDRELDAAIEWALFHDDPIDPPAYTASLDAAMTLVPEGWWWTTGNCSVSADASVGPDMAYCDKKTLIRFDSGIHVDLKHPSTPALALCAAALRAKSHLQENSNG